MTYVCRHCLAAVSIVLDGTTFKLFDDDEPVSCPWCGEEEAMRYHPILGKAARQGGPFQHQVMSAEDFYRACRGLGLPGSYGADPELVKALFGMGRVCGLSMEKVGEPSKTLLHSIRVETADGRFDLHLGPSTHGAVIYRISEVQDGRTAEATAEQDRAQAGPAPASSAGYGGDALYAGSDDALPDLPEPDQVRT